MKNITINVDDLGLSSAINQAVIELANNQRINSTSFMSLGKISNDELNALNKTKIAIGLHLDFTELSKDLLGISGLKELIKLTWLRQLPREKIKTNIELQLDLFEQKINRPPLFIDGHQHIHQFPIIRETLIETISKRYSQKIMIRSTKPTQSNLKAKIIHLLGGRTLDKLCSQADIPQNIGFSGVYNFQAAENELALLWDKWLEKTNNYGLIMCHPAIKNNSWQDSIKHARESEFSWLSSQKFADSLQKHKIKLIK